VSIILVFTLIFTINVGVFAKSSKEIKIDEKAKVHFIDKDGKVYNSDLDVEFFVKLSKDGYASTTKKNKSNDDFSTHYIPVDDGAIRITDTIYRSYTNSDVNFVIDVAIGTLFPLSWARLGGLIKYVGSGTTVAETTWKGAALSASVATAINRATAWAHAEPTYNEMYQYKTWSTYWNAYLIYDVLIRHSDSNYNNVIDVEFWQSGMDGYGLY